MNNQKNWVVEKRKKKIKKEMKKKTPSRYVKMNHHEGAAGARGEISYPERTIETYAWGLGQATNNQKDGNYGWV